MPVPARSLAALRAAIDEALAAGGPDAAVVVHDPSRSPAGDDLLERGLALLRESGCAAVVAAGQPTDTLKLADADGIIERTVERSLTCDIRTPQVYRAGDLRAALASADPDVVDRALRDGDDAFLPGLVEGVVRVLPLQPAAASSASARSRSTG